MKKLLLYGLFVCLLALPFSTSVSAAEDTILIESESEWEYVVVDDEGFDAMDPDWMTRSFKSDWSVGTAPFGDRISHDQAAKYGWVGEDDGIFLRKTFELDSVSDIDGLHFYLNIFYDNSVHVYLNGTEIFAHDNGGQSDWVDEQKLIKLEDIAKLLVKGDNVLAASVHDNIGGREFDLSFFASEEEYEEAVAPPEPDDPDDQTKPDEPKETNDPAVTKAPEEFGSGLPFTNAPVKTDSPIVTVYVTADPIAAVPAQKVSYIAPLAMVGGAFAVAVLMVIVALLVSRKPRRSGGEK